MKFTYGKQEKLKSKKLIEQLFAEGISVSSYPLRMVFLKCSHNAKYPIQVGISVPKRKVNKAVDRNRIKRVVREVYRHNKQLFSEELEKEQYIAMLLYSDKEEWKQDLLEAKMKKLAAKFVEKIKES